MMSALVRADSRLRTEGQRVPLSFPGRHFQGSLAFSVRHRSISAAGEWATVGGARLRQWSLLWRPASGRGILLGRSVHAGRSRSPFGIDQRLQSEWSRVEILQLGAQWKSAIHAVSLVAAKRSRSDVFTVVQPGAGAADAAATAPSVAIVKSAATREKNVRMSLAWLIQPEGGPTITSFLEHHAGADRRWRLGLRGQSSSMRKTRVDLQLQVGLRPHPSVSARQSGLLAVGVRRRSARWDGNVLSMVRAGGSGSVLLYAAIPTVEGGFPVLGGSSRRRVTIGRISYMPFVRLRIEAWGRRDQIDSGSAFHWQMQATLTL